MLKISTIYPALILFCYILGFSSPLAQTSFIDIEHPLTAGADRYDSELIAGANGHIFIIDNEGYLLRSIDNGLSWESIETPFQGYEMYGAEGSHQGILVVSSDKYVPGEGAGNTWVSLDNGLTWQGLGYLVSGHYTYDPSIWVKPESITIKRVETEFGLGTNFYTIYDYDDDWTTDMGGQYVMPNGNEMKILQYSGQGACYTVCSWLLIVKQDDEDILIPVYEEDGEEIMNFVIRDVVILSDEHWVLSTSLGIHITEDGGQNWTVYDEDSFRYTYNIIRTASGKIFAETIYSVNERRLFESSDDGETWLEVNLENNQSVLPYWFGRFVMSSNGYLYIYHKYSWSNYILRSENFFTSTADESVLNLPKSVKLHQNYPNPFNPSTIISFDLATPAYTTLEIYDIQGRLVERVFSNTYMQEGTHKVTWNSGSHASGVYFYRVQVGNEVLSQKMLLIK